MSGDDSYVKNEKTIQVLWTCGFCETDKLKGLDDRFCPGCGAAQNPEWRYYPTVDEDKSEVAEHETEGADKNCSACENPNKASATFCSNCGSPMDGSERAALIDERVAAQDVQSAKSQDSQAGPSTKWKLIGAGVGLFVVLILVMIFWKEERGVLVEGHNWSRSIDIEQFQEVTEKAWQDQAPKDGRRIKCSSKQRSTKKVENGETCEMKKKDNGDGTYKEQEVCKTEYKEVPVYDDYCEYRVNRWKTTDTRKASGKALKPEWPKLSLRECSSVSLGCERAGARKETYAVMFKDEEGNSHSCDFKETQWAKLEKGASHKMNFRKVGGGIDCGSLHD